MGKVTGFMEFERVEEDYKPVPERVKHHKEFIIGLTNEQAKVQAAIQGDAVRITGAKRDDLQAAMALLRKEVPDVPISFNNFRD